MAYYHHAIVWIPVTKSYQRPNVRLTSNCLQFSTHVGRNVNQTLQLYLIDGLLPCEFWVPVTRFNKICPCLAKHLGAIALFALRLK